MSFDRKRKLKRPATAFCGKGQPVRSRTGRTRGKVYYVVDVFTDKYGKRFALVCDGERYTTALPKRKSVGHLEPLAAEDALQNSALLRSDAEIRQFLMQYR